jgi:hypothetical protein
VPESNKLLLYDGSVWRGREWRGPGAVLGAAWQPGTKRALAVGEGGLLAQIDGDGGIEELESGTKDNLIGPFWKPDGTMAIVLRGPGDKVYTV